ncbi:hypothetical protein EVAR_76286_1 [Eumeta japonica]|uniref:Uncharacterized protein n=1 Tax=Eumeta variegata TaxID=151549 RepID=A0A4C1UP02_EUMVA|nr:hypothetical protein EVAR_76286_1 [Eumeta japonica]
MITAQVLRSPTLPSSPPRSYLTPSRRFRDELQFLRPPFVFHLTAELTSARPVMWPQLALEAAALQLLGTAPRPSPPPPLLDPAERAALAALYYDVSNETKISTERHHRYRRAARGAARRLRRAPPVRAQLVLFHFGTPELTGADRSLISDSALAPADPRPERARPHKNLPARRLPASLVALSFLYGIRGTNPEFCVESGQCGLRGLRAG